MEDLPPRSILGVCRALLSECILVAWFLTRATLLSDNSTPPLCSNGLSFKIRDQEIHLTHPLGQAPNAPSYSRIPRSRLDTLSHWYSPARRYVEIIRQDHPTQPQYGLALGFEFHEETDTFPYKPAYARIHFKDFSWGGPEFSAADSFNYTGVTNEISHDLTIRITAFHNDTIEGFFSGVLLSGAGPMLFLDDGFFCVQVRRLAY